MKATKTRTWTLKIEKMTGVVSVVRFRAATLGEAVTLACQEFSLANVLAAWQGKTRWF